MVEPPKGNARLYQLDLEPVRRAARLDDCVVHTVTGGLFGLAVSSSSVAATVAPSVRIVPATALARARVWGPGPWERGGQGVDGRRRALVSRADVQPGYSGGPVRLVRDPGHHHLRRAGSRGRRGGARAAVVHDDGHPAEQLLLVDLADDEAVVDVVDRGQAGPAAGEEDPAALRADRLDGHPGDVLRGVRGHAAEAHVHRRRTGVQERLQPVRERTVVGQDPRPGLHDVEVRHALRRTQRRVRRQPRLVGEDVVADVVHRRQADRRATAVERLAVQRVHPLGVVLPQHPPVGLAPRGRCARPPPRRVVPRRQSHEVEAREHIADAQVLGHVPCAGRHQAGRQQRVTSLGRRAERVEPRGDQLGSEPERVLRRRWLRAGDHRAHRRPSGTSGTSTRASRLANSSSGGAHTRACAPSPRNATASPASGSTSPRDPHVVNNTRTSQLPISVGSGFRPVIPRHDPGLAASLPVRYTLKWGRE
jgi:hypothetical protein